MRWLFGLGVFDDEIVDEGFKEGLEGRKLAGLPKDGPIFVVFTEMPKPSAEPPSAVSQATGPAVV